LIQFDNAFRAIKGYRKDLRNFQTDPFGIISVDCEGNLSTFSPELARAITAALFGGLFYWSFEWKALVEKCLIEHAHSP
jgi:hypothetical protein